LVLQVNTRTAGAFMADGLPDSSVLRGELLLDGKLLCAFDSRNSQEIPWSVSDDRGARPATWADAGPNPTIVARIRVGSGERLSLIGPEAADLVKNMRMVHDAKGDISTYRITFALPLPAGPYEFWAGCSRPLPCFLRCGFTTKP
jgi:hypothetical protein